MLNIYCISINNLFNYIVGYIFDFDTCISDINIDELRNWPSDDEINDAVRIAYENANAFADLLQMKNQLKNRSADTLIPELPETNMNNSQLENEKISQNVTIEQVA